MRWATLLLVTACRLAAAEDAPAPSSLVEQMVEPGFVVESAPPRLTHSRHRTWLGVRLRDGRLGSSVTAGDVNGDGLPEVFLGARRGVNPGLNGGLLIGIPGSAQGPAWEGAQIQLGERRQRLGHQGQLAVGRIGTMPTALWMADGSELQAGSVRRVDLWGTTPGTDEVFPLENWAAPGSLCLPGDVDGDGLADFLVAANRASVQARYAGEVRLYGGSASGVPLRLLWTLKGLQPQERLGYCLRPLGDLDGDGLADFAIGSPGYGVPGRPQTGRVVVYRGGKSGPVPHWEFVGTMAHQRVGAGFDAGDLDGDGQLDLALGAPGRVAEIDGDQPDKDDDKVVGRVFLFRSIGSTWAPQPDVTIMGPGSARSFGNAVAIVPKHLSDGRAALFVGAPLATSRHSVEGYVQSFAGHPRLLVAPCDHEWLGNQAGNQFGMVVTGVGDLDGDGFQEVAFGSPFAHGPRGGRVDLWFGGRPPADPPERLLAVDSKSSATLIITGIEEDQRRRAEIRRRAERQRQVATAGVLAALVTIVGGTLIFRRWKRRHSLETEATVRAERDRFARDLHDGLGSELARLAAIAEIEDESVFPKAEPHELKESIAAAARVAMQTVDEVVWAAKPAQDNLEALLGFLMETATQYFSGSAIELRQSMPPSVPDIHVTSLKRRNVHFILKEAFANALKHSRASAVTFRVSFESGILTFIVQDDGRGLNVAETLSIEDGHADGLRNMNIRAREIGASLSIISDHTGTTICLTLPFTSSQGGK